jgi:hypothetical protein
MHKAMALKAIRSTLEHGQSVRSFMATVCKTEESIRQAAHALAEIAEALQGAGFEFHVVDPEWQQLAELRGYARTAWIETLASELVKGIHATDGGGNGRAASIIKEIHDLTEIAGVINRSNLDAEFRDNSHPDYDYAMKA